jgi:hypothetical protein
VGAADEAVEVIERARITADDIGRAGVHRAGKVEMAIRPAEWVGNQDSPRDGKRRAARNGSILQELQG